MSHFFTIRARSIIEGTKESLQRLGLEYVDVIFAHRSDHTGREDWKHVLDSSLRLLYTDSPDGGGCPRLQLCRREGLGKTAPYHLLPSSTH